MAPHKFVLSLKNTAKIPQSAAPASGGGRPAKFSLSRYYASASRVIHPSITTSATVTVGTTAPEWPRPRVIVHSHCAPLLIHAPAPFFLFSCLFVSAQLCSCASFTSKGQADLSRADIFSDTATFEKAGCRQTCHFCATVSILWSKECVNDTTDLG